MSNIDSTNPANLSTNLAKSNPANKTDFAKQESKNPHQKSSLKSILIVGNGGREYAIGEHLKKDFRVGKIYFAQGNAGTQNLGQNIELKENAQIVDFCKQNQIDWVIIGGENALVAGLSDDLRANGIKAFGPSKEAAKLEGSKAFMKDFLSEFGIPTARYIQTSDVQKALDFARTLNPPIVVKASGLCAGKGVIIAQSYDKAKSTIESMLCGDSFGEAGKCVVVEEYLEGYELSVFGICDGEDFVLLPACQDHKQLYDDDKGPNTGGMGAYTPTPLCDEKLLGKIKSKIFSPTLDGMKKRGAPFCGVLFAGIMVVKQNGKLEPYLLEFNVRFGDPECEVLMPLLETPLLDICEAIESKNLKNLQVKFSDKHCVAVVLASHNYPFGTSTPQPIKILPFDTNLGSVCYAGVSKDGTKSTQMLASGGRVALAVGIADTLSKAQKNAYKIAESIIFEGAIYRKDIANKALKGIAK
ncbi:phosphoribosylamine--glycine ligase [Helicobacter sp. T3_23-1056]